MASLKRGDKVEWNTSQGPTEGTVLGTVTAPTRVKGYTAEASTGHPEIRVRSAKSGQEAIHRADALRKVR